MDNSGFMSILNGLINGTRPPDAEGLDWDRLIPMAYMQNLLPATAYMNRRWGLCRDEERNRVLGEILRQTVYTGANRNKRFEELSRLFSENGIEHMPVKGWYLKELYPLPELRTFGDVDVLIHRRDRERADRLMISEGFSQKENWEPTYSYIRGNERYELHTNLMDGSLDGRADMPEYFEKAWSFGVKRSGECFEPGREFHFIYIMCHIAKHLYGGGAGMRMYLDVGLFVKEYGGMMDWKYIDGEFERLGLSRFYETVMGAVNRWFGLEPSGEETEAQERLLEYTLSGDLFGKTRDHSAVKIRNAKSGSRASAILHEAFPPAEALEKRYTFLKGRPWLLPAAWVSRLVINRASIGSRLDSAKKIAAADMDGVKGYDEFMREIGL